MVINIVVNFTINYAKEGLLLVLITRVGVIGYVCIDELICSWMHLFSTT